MWDFDRDLQFWMTNLPPKLRSLPIINLAIPGSHDSTTFGITKKSRISPDARPPLQLFKFLDFILSPFMVKWSQTQTADVITQLNFGVRYFDLRISTRPRSDEFFFVHNLYSEKVAVVLEDFRQFLDGHPKEVVILDCQHFFKLDAGHHQQLVKLLKEVFKNKILPYSPSMAHVTLDYITQKRQCQVIVIYRAAVNEEVLWPAVSFPTPWPDTVSISYLLNFLNIELRNRDSLIGFVSQFVMTPTVWYACKHFFSSLRKTCVLPLQKHKYCWLKEQEPGNGGINVVISDFVEEDSFRFCREVVKLNKKLL